MRVALYARVSTQRQQQNQNIEQQIMKLREAINSNPQWHLSEQHIYLDDGHSGTRLSRPGLDRLRDNASLAQFDSILCTTPDRLARKYVHQVLIIESCVIRV